MGSCGGMRRAELQTTVKIRVFCLWQKPQLTDTFSSLLFKSLVAPSVTPGSCGLHMYIHSSKPAWKCASKTTVLCRDPVLAFMSCAFPSCDELSSRLSCLYIGLAQAWIARKGSAS